MSIAGRCIACSTSSGTVVGPGMARNSRPALTTMVLLGTLDAGGCTTAQCLAHIPEKWTLISGLPDISSLECANRKHPICVIFRKGYAPTDVSVPGRDGAYRFR